MWTAPVEGDDDGEDTDVAIDADEGTVSASGRPLSIYGGAAMAAQASEPTEKPRCVGPAKIARSTQRYLDLNGLKPEDLKAPTPVKARRPKEPAPGHGDRRRKLAEDIKRWTTPTR